MIKLARLISVVLVFGTLMTACVPTASPTPSFETVVAQTQAAMQTQLAIVSTITPYVPPTETPILPTFTPSPTTSVPTTTPTAVTPTPAQAYCISNFSNVNVPNKTQMKGGQNFTKTWTLTNGGSASWTTDFKVIYVSGDSMNASAVNLDRVVDPGTSINVSVDLISPTNDGEHQANFMILTDKGETFGIGSNCDRPFWVLIRTSGLFQVTSASLTADPGSYIGTCPTTLYLKASITSNGAGTVTYTIRSDSKQSNTYEMVFTAAGTKTQLDIPWKVKESTDLELRIYIAEPNHQIFDAVTIPVSCTP